jgi:hypothetical protein
MTLSVSNLRFRPILSGNPFLRYPEQKNFFHTCPITNDLNAGKALLAGQQRFWLRLEDVIEMIYQFSIMRRDSWHGL